MTYTTKQGDTWDMIALAMYGEETKVTVLMQHRENITLLDYQIFPAGIVVAGPDEGYGYEEEAPTDLPDWRR